MKYNNKLEEIKNMMIQDLTDDEIITMIAVINPSTNGVYDEAILYNMDDIDNLEAGTTPSRLLHKTAGDFNINHQYFTYDGYDNLVSYYNKSAFIDSIDYMLDEIVDNAIQAHDDNDARINDYIDNIDIIRALEELQARALSQAYLLVKRSTR